MRPLKSHLKRSNGPGNSAAAVAERCTDGSGIIVRGTVSLSTPIVSVQDGPRMSLKNFGGKQAAPFGKGGKRRKKLLAKALVKGAKSAKRGADLAKLDTAARNALDTSAFALPKTRQYPIQDRGHAIMALALSKGKPEQGAVWAAVHKRYPDLGNSGA